MTKKQLQLFKALYKQDLTLAEITKKTGLCYEEWLEIMIHETDLDEFIEVTEFNDPMETNLHLNSKGRSIIEENKKQNLDTTITRIFSLLALFISLASLIISLK